ncbi:MAG: hypothetical protein RMA76_37420 [Deltaproteobacteria bacterium]|jgi:hypothetical protein
MDEQAFTRFIEVSGAAGLIGMVAVQVYKEVARPRRAFHRALLEDRFTKKWTQVLPLPKDGESKQYEDTLLLLDPKALVDELLAVARLAIASADDSSVEILRVLSGLDEIDATKLSDIVDTSDADDEEAAREEELDARETYARRLYMRIERRLAEWRAIAETRWRLRMRVLSGAFAFFAFFFLFENVGVLDGIMAALLGAAIAPLYKDLLTAANLLNQKTK